MQAAAWCFLLLALVELLVRTLGDRFIACGEDVDFRRRVRQLTSAPSAEVVIVGDSLAQRGIAPGSFPTASPHGVLNLGVTAGTGVIARALAGSATWRPDHVVFAGNPALVFDAAPLEVDEAQITSILDRPLWPFVTGDVLLGKISQAFARRADILIAIRRMLRLRRVLPPGDIVWEPGLREEEGGFLAFHPESMPSSADRTRYAHMVLKQWFARPDRENGFRRRMVSDALRAWSGPSTARHLVMMPQSDEYRVALQSYVSVAMVRDAWRTAAHEGDADLLDCTQSVSDDAFGDHYHLEASAARAFSVGLAAWVQDHKVPTGCRVIE